MHANRTRRTSAVALAAVVALAVAVPIATADRGHGDGHGSAHGQGRGIDAAIARHLANVEECDAEGLVDDYTRDARVFFPDGVVVSGRAELTALYENFVKPFDQGGLCGLRLQVVDRFREGKSAIVKVQVTADFLAEPYFSTDSYIFRRGKIAAEVSTFDASKLKFR